MNSYTYLLRHKFLPCFKIGKANDPVLRAKQIDRAAFDFSRSKIVRISDSRKAKALERSLHLLLSDFSYHSSHLPEDGVSEWFDEKCFDEIIRFIEGDFSKLAICSMDSFPVDQINVDRVKPGPKNYGLERYPVRHRRALSDMAEYIDALRKRMPLYRGLQFRGQIYIVTSELLQLSEMVEGSLLLRLPVAHANIVFTHAPELASIFPGFHYRVCHAGVINQCCRRGKHQEACCFHRAKCKAFGLDGLVDATPGVFVDIPRMV